MSPDNRAGGKKSPITNWVKCLQYYFIYKIILVCSCNFFSQNSKLHSSFIWLLFEINCQGLKWFGRTWFWIESKLLLLHPSCHRPLKQTQSSRGCSANTFIINLFVQVYSQYLHTQSIWARQMTFWENVHLPPHVTCHKSCVLCPVSHHISQMSCVTCIIFIF